MNLRRMQSRQWAALACLVWLGPEAAAQPKERALPEQFPRGVAACYGRVYDAAFLAVNPHHRVRSFFMFKDFTPDPLTEKTPQPSGRQVEEDMNSSENLWVNVLVRFKNRPSVFNATAECLHVGTNRAGCGKDCDGGSFAVNVVDKSLVIDRSDRHARLVLSGPCGDDEEGAGAEINFNRDGVDFRLDRLPMNACLDARRDARPPWAGRGAPMRVRFARRDGVCHVRTYTAAHLARHPRQQVAAMSLKVIERAKLGESGEPYLRLRVSARLRSGESATREARCFAGRFAYDCHAEDENESYGGSNWAFYLRRAGERSITIYDQGFAMANESLIGQFLRLPLGSDDHIFRLDERSDPRCDAR
jgi:hypothetical protein